MTTAKHAGRISKEKTKIIRTDMPATSPRLKIAGTGLVISEKKPIAVVIEVKRHGRKTLSSTASQTLGSERFSIYLVIIWIISAVA